MVTPNIFGIFHPPFPPEFPIWMFGLRLVHHLERREKIVVQCHPLADHEIIERRLVGWSERLPLGLQGRTARHHQKNGGESPNRHGGERKDAVS